jgi:hypothetical protein
VAFAGRAQQRCGEEDQGKRFHPGRFMPQRHRKRNTQEDESVRRRKIKVP